MRALFRRIFPARRTWRSGSIDVHYQPRLDGGGTLIADDVVAFVRRTFGPSGRLPFDHAFEWCSGPGFIGFALLAAGLCRRLTLADVNPAAIACAARTVARNGLGDRVELYVSDNFARIPPGPRFDLVVSNPPNYCGLNPQHPYYGRLKDDLRPNDRDWRIHRAFYASVAGWLVPGAELLIEEINPGDAEVRTPGFDVPYDIRPRPAIDDFRAMIADGGLEYVGTTPLCMVPGGFRAEFVRSRMPGGARPAA